MAKEYGDKLFYKYRSIGEYTEKLLINNELYFNDPSEYNDPFDCKVNYFHKGTRDEWIEFFSEYSISPEEGNLILDDYLKKRILKRKRGEILLDNRKKICRFLKEKARFSIRQA